jgi:membrane glycosyltransferase
MKDKGIFNFKFRHYRLIILALLVIPLATWAITQLYLIFQPNGIRPLEWVQLAFASILFVWLAIACWTAIIGFVLHLFRLDPLSLKFNKSEGYKDVVLEHKHAVIMPVYNEDTSRIMAGFESCVLAVHNQKQQNHFDFYMLSDTQDPQLIEAEKKLWSKCMARLPETIRERCFYRHRKQNTERKVGNLKDFFQRWGNRYTGVVVLDADSMMSGEKIVELSFRLENNEAVGLIQTIPMPVRQNTFFARFIQFAAHTYSPMLATGLNFWQGDAANYWGHNAIIRTEAFIKCCGLPALPGKKPFGGDVLSHDFVEAALLRRDGWTVFLLLDDKGSYEEVPSNIVDYATRDRRWVQGNLQHLSLLNAKRLKMVNRLHMAFGAFAYLSSICLLVILLAGTSDAVLKAIEKPDYFTHLYQLFPTWIITPKTLMITTMYLTIALLFLPKLLGLIGVFVQRSKAFGGNFAFFKGAIIEFIFAVLIAPIMLFFHSYFVINVLTGQSVSWDAQQREGKMVPWSSAFKLGFIPTVIGSIWLAVVVTVVPSLLYWLLPVLTGLILTIPVIRYSSSEAFGKWCKRHGVFLIAQEREKEFCIEHVAVAMLAYQEALGIKELEPPPESVLPPDSWQEMPKQAFR